MPEPSGRRFSTTSRSAPSARSPWRRPIRKTIYAGTGESDIRSDLSSGNGVYKSSDGGSTWTHIGLEDTRQISRIVVDPRDANVVYVGALGHAYGSERTTWRVQVRRWGTHWTKVLDEGPEIGVSDLAICSGNPQILFAGTWNTHRPPWSTYAPIDGPGGGLYRSQDAGKTWSRLNGNGLPEGDWGRIGVDVAPDGKRVYALIQAKKAGLYRSDDGGDTWILENADPRLTSRAWYFNSITIDPQNPDVIYIPNVALYRSGRRREDNFDRPRRAGRRRLPSDLDRSQEFRQHGSRNGPGHHSQSRPRPDLEHLVQPAHGAALPRDHRQPVSLRRLWRATG